MPPLYRLEVLFMICITKDSWNEKKFIYRAPGYCRVDTIIRDMLRRIEYVLGGRDPPKNNGLHASA